jgi:2,5-dichloro-2,5-cyclohexadiene-1,4-diol dehydrogenase 1
VNLQSMQGQTFFVTGFTAGIGKATAKLLIQAGANVFGLTRDSKKGNDFLSSLDLQKETKGGQFGFFCGDVALEHDVQNALQECLKKFGVLQGAFNCAGALGELRCIEESSIVNFDQVVSANLKSVFLCLKHQIRIGKMQPKKVEMSIVNCASAAAEGAFPLGAVYAASKAGVVSLTQSAAREVAGTGIRINALLPGGTLTEMTAYAQSLFPNWISEGSQKSPLGRFAEPEEIAQAAVFLLSKNSSYMTGASLRADGGVNA